MSIDYDLKPNKFVLDDKFPDYDLFSDNLLGVSTVVSVELKKALEFNKIKGLDFKLMRCFY